MTNMHKEQLMASHCERLETRHGPNDSVFTFVWVFVYRVLHTSLLPHHALWGQDELMCNFQSETSTNMEKYTEFEYFLWQFITAHNVNINAQTNCRNEV